MTITKTISGVKNFFKMESYALAFSKFAAAFAALAFTNSALAQDFGETVSAAMDAFREVRSQSAAPENVKAIFAKASEAEEDGCMNFCGFCLGMSADDARTLAGYYSLKNDEWNTWAVPSSKTVYRFKFSLKGVRRITKGGNSFDELSQAVANRIGSMRAKHNDDYDLIGYEYKNIDGQTALISEKDGLVLEDSNLARKAAAEAEAATRMFMENIEHQTADKVQLWEGGPYWAMRNVGAEMPWESGLYFWWGDTIGYKRDGGAWVASDGSTRNYSFNDEKAPTFEKRASTLRNEGWTTSVGILSPEHDAAHVHWNGSWRLPTKQELDAFKRNCDWIWTMIKGVNGYVVRGRGDYASNCIFLPAAGYGYGPSLNYDGPYGYYWSSVPSSDSSSRSWDLYFTSDKHVTYNLYRNYGFPVRPVQGFAE